MFIFVNHKFYLFQRRRVEEEIDASCFKFEQVKVDL